MLTKIVSVELNLIKNYKLEHSQKFRYKIELI